jgi:hypothetical protein
LGVWGCYIITIMTKQEETISNLSHGFLENALWHLSNTTKTYQSNCDNHRNDYGHRSLIASRENRHSTSALLNFYTAIEFIITTEAFHKGLQKFDSNDNAIKKARNLNLYSEGLLQALTELSIPRDTISHAYLWETQRTLDKDYNIIQVDNAMWEKYLSKLRPKYKDNVDLNNGITVRYEFNVVPDKIDFLDGVKCLYIVNAVYSGILRESKSS